MTDISIFTFKCPVCGKGDIPYPFDDEGCGYCRHCGASLEQIKWHWDIQCKIGKIALYILLSMVLISYLFSIF